MIHFFVHIPKTAGTSLRSILERQYHADELLFFDPPNPYYLPEVKQLFAAALELKPKTKAVIGHFTYGIHTIPQVQDYTYITFFRDPVARAISHYFHDYEYNIHHDPGEYLIQGLPITKYMALPQIQCFYHNVHTRYIVASEERLFDTPLQASDIELCKKRIQQDFLFIGRQENFMEDIRCLGNLLGWSIDNIPDLNVRYRLQPFHICTDEEIGFLETLNATDYSLFEQLKFAGQSLCRSESSFEEALHRRQRFQEKLIEVQLNSLKNLRSRYLLVEAEKMAFQEQAMGKQ